MPSSSFISFNVIFIVTSFNNKNSVNLFLTTFVFITILQLSGNEYLFDIDIPGKLVAQGYPHIAKVKIGIIHLYAKKTMDFVRKQRRRVYDYLFFKKEGSRSYQWHGFLSGALKFSIYTILIFPILGMSIRGYLKHRDIAWWLHPLACWITLGIYGWAVIKRALGLSPREFQRQDWQK